MAIAIEAPAQAQTTAHNEQDTQPDAAAIKAELRRQMYERIARGHAHSEAEAQAQHKLHHRA